MDTLACSNPPVCHPSFHLSEHFHTQRQKSGFFPQLNAPQFTKNQESRGIFGACFLSALTQWEWKNKMRSQQINKRS